MRTKNWLKGILLVAALSAPVWAAAADAAPAGSRAGGKALPRLVDLGAGACVPCKAMAPILEGLRAEYAGRMDVVFIDVWKDRAAAEAHGVRMIPTQIFYGADGKELARHEGFIDRAGILARWKALGVRL
ncbi:thioredoxin family protein [Anaeromyxobacter dehalogenans]|uniref:Thioredoxin-related protein n=1 Tax=Anaeromyxobacter dehalogenans (strain 2CP-C) TaxID=290397 RepID=Q2IPR8_ANADE|nr:thioredoxin family protein [Anaeromyxobacter dehalogenans]ABC80800.1 Thioredoxin-related protein [Anaeromyxobacter dehalogenans 2CP-C]